VEAAGVRAFILKEDDFAGLLSSLDVDPKLWGSGRELTAQEREIYEQAYRFYQYRVRTWMDRVKA
jgi:hypothetical protein